MENYGIKMLDINKLHAHPKNPRKNVGDVSELAESIKTSGIMQNLTVVPFESDITGQRCDDEYIVVIGHRRMAAAKAAGLQALPCIIKEMTESEQLATMLAENIQRSELSPVEQAQGIQMMLDIGESVKDIGEKTGFSESTVRRRMKLLEMDCEKLIESEKRGATLSDYEKLNEIEDIEQRNSVLESIGTNNFAMNLRSAIDAQTKDKNRKRIFAILDTFAEHVTTYPNGYSYERVYGFRDDTEVEVPENAKPGEYVYYPSAYNVSLYKKDSGESCKETAAEKKRREAFKKEEERQEAVKDLAKRAYELRRKFVEEYYPSAKDREKILKFVWDMACFAGGEVIPRKIDELCSTKLGECGTYEEESAVADTYFEKSPEKAVFNAAYLMSGDCDKSYIQPWYGTWEDEESCIDKLLENLEAFGYEMSDEEKKLQDGSHELFVKEG